jgi:hypothetical protein
MPSDRLTCPLLNARTCMIETMNDIHECLCACVLACLRVCVRAFAFACACASTCTCTCTSACACACLHLCMRMYHIHSDSSAIVVDHENHRVQFWDKDGSWSRLIGICVVCCECAVKAIEMYM